MATKQDSLLTLQKDIDSFKSVTELWKKSCQDFAYKDAFTHLGATLSYAELDTLANNFAAYIQNCTQLQPGDRIAIQLPNMLQYPIAVLGALRAGLVIVNTNPLYTAEEALSQFNDAGVKAIVILANGAHLLEDILAETSIDTVFITELGDLQPILRRFMVNFSAKYFRKIVPRYRLAQAVSFRAALEKGGHYPFTTIVTDPNQTALIQYTVGTTGAPKGAMLSHRNLIANVLQLQHRLPDTLRVGEEIAIAPLPLYHIYGFLLHCLVMPMLGAQVVLITNPRDLNGLVNELGRWDFTVFSGINTLFSSLCQNPAFNQLDMSRLKLTLSGGMALTRSVSDEWEKATGCQIVQGYGLTEAAPAVSIEEPHKYSFGSVGKPLPLTEIRIVGEQGQGLVSGETGELYVRGPQVMIGYWRDDSAIPDTDGWLATGDIARQLDDGTLRIVDRKQDIITISGFPVYPNELENTITSHPDILECAVIGLPDDTCGEVIKLFVVTSNRRLSVKQVREYCRERLTSYKVPRLVEFRAHLPKSNVGKVLRRSLLDEELNRLQKMRKRF